MQLSLEQTFNETAAAAYAAFPQQLARLVVLLVPDTDKPVYVSPQVAGQLTQSTAAIRAAVARATRYMRDRNWAGYADGSYMLAGTRTNLIALDHEKTAGFFSARFTKEMKLVFTLDHEIGHHIMKNGFPINGVSPQEAESAADAFAMLRHIQRYGKNTDHAGNICQSVAASIVLFSDTEHYTPDAMQRAIDVAEKMGDDFFKLPLQDTAKLATDIAVKTRLSPRTLGKLQKAFLPVAQQCETRISGDIIQKICDGDKQAYATICRETLAVMKKHQDDPDIFKAGKLCLSHPKIKEFMSADLSWKNALDFIDSHAPKASRFLNSLWQKLI